MASKTNAVRIVEQAGIPCREAFYEYNENDLNGRHAAESLGKPAEEVFKTLVARGEKPESMCFAFLSALSWT